MKIKLIILVIFLHFGANAHRYSVSEDIEYSDFLINSNTSIEATEILPENVVNKKDDANFTTKKKYLDDNCNFNGRLNSNSLEEFTNILSMTILENDSLEIKYFFSELLSSFTTEIIEESNRILIKIHIMEVVFLFQMKKLLCMTYQFTI